MIAPIFGIDRFWAGVLCLSFFEGSFAAEIIRGGIQAVDRGQYEGADAISLTPADKYRYIVVPQALPLILPPLTGLLISLTVLSVNYVGDGLRDALDPRIRGR